MTLIQSLLAFLVTLGVLVTFHELGHYLVAKWCGVKILRFSIGIGRVVWSHRFNANGTEWAISALPLGGYVKMLDARESEQVILPQDLPHEFCQQSVWKRIAIVAAGPLANFLLAIVVLSGLYWHGLSEPASKVRVISQQSIAWQAGLRYGDRIISVKDKPVQAWSEFQYEVLQHALDARSIELTVIRAVDDKFDELSLVLPLDSLTSKDLEGNFMAKLGLSIAQPRTMIAKVLPDGAAMRAGLLDGDAIVEINGKMLQDTQEFVETVADSANVWLNLHVERGNRDLMLSVCPTAEARDGRNVGRVQVQLLPSAEMLQMKWTLSQSIAKAVDKTWTTSIMVLKMLGKMITGDVSLKNITGPLTIADYAGQTARVGLVSFLSFIASVSISLGVMNLLPIPVLDGGHLLYYSLELFTGKPVSERFAENAQKIGLGILFGMMALAFFNDIVRLMS